MTKLKKSDKVSWNSINGKTTGTVERKITKDVDFNGKKYRASKNHPKVEVKSNKTGKKAIHNEDSVKKK